MRLGEFIFKIIYFLLSPNPFKKINHMNWKQNNGLASRINNLPLVIAGPILRRTEPFSVSVWIALRANPGNIILKIFEGNGNVVVVESEPTSLIKLGDSLYVSVITAKIDFTTGVPLSEGVIYQYDIQFPGVDPWSGTTLKSVGILSKQDAAIGGINLIAYLDKGQDRPSFSLPPSSVNDLRIVHASCRKPHGGDLDAMAAIDILIKESAASANSRPHQLYLTGDQIYADDVADVLLYLIQDAESVLIGWQEALPLIEPSDNIRPGFRADARNNIIKDLAKLSVGDEPESSKSHLMKLSEFYLMYLFVWSPVLWNEQESSFPMWEDVFPPSDGLPVVQAYYLNKEASQIWVYKEKSDFIAETSAVMTMWESLSMVRRAIANVPCYMICDDHDVTDDWYIDGQWTETVLDEENLLGRRIIQNAISAYAIFQDWGNVPNETQYGVNQNNTLPKILESISANGYIQSIADSIGTMIIPTINRDASSYGLQGIELENSIILSYRIDFNNFRVVVLDSRTRRFFPNIGGGPALLSQRALNDQLTLNLQNMLPDQEFVLLIAPAPIIGHTIWEDSLQPYLVDIQSITFKSLIDRSRIIDWEAWSFNKNCFEEVLSTLAIVEKVIILSGDVHFSFTAECKYWIKSQTENRVSSFAQLTSSSLKNSNSKTKDFASESGNALDIIKTLAQFGHPNALPTEGYARYVVGSKINSRFMQFRDLDGSWSNFATSESLPSTYSFFAQNSQTHRVDPVIGFDFAYSLFFKNDARSADARGIYTGAANSYPYTLPSDYIQTLAYHHSRETKWSDYTIAVGMDCLGEVTMQTVGNALEVTHALWYSKDGVYHDQDFVIQPYTVHVCFLNPNDNDETPNP
ncbi:hypothetical protein [Hymenobacter rubripertinctus]|uniref:hypothetical protein n=1 Tax=Hymenobacter rubripertinctus TaxID=2029981 RepID=UPI0011C3C4E0|nr:hypothetical protein [Hymenobacter rubripertinctus]